MFQFKKLVLAVLVCIPIFAINERKKTNKNNILKKTVIAGLVVGGGVLAFSIYKQISDEISVWKKLWNTPAVLKKIYTDAQVSKKLRSALGSLKKVQFDFGSSSKGKMRPSSGARSSGVVNGTKNPAISSQSVSAIALEHAWVAATKVSGNSATSSQSVPETKLEALKRELAKRKLVARL